MKPMVKLITVITRKVNGLGSLPRRKDNKKINVSSWIIDRVTLHA